MTLDFTIDVITYGLLGLTLVLAACMDLRERRIPNKISLFLLLLFVLTTGVKILHGSDVYSVFLWPVLAALAVFVGAVFLFHCGIWGGGDAKLVTVTTLFAPISLVLPMLWLMAVVGGGLSLGVLVWSRFGKKKYTVPYGVAITVAGLWLCLRQTLLSNTSLPI